MTRYAEVSDVEGAFRTFTNPEKARAAYLLNAVGARISEVVKANPDFDTEAAKAVSIDIVVHAMAVPMDLAHHTAYSRTVGPRTKSGSLDSKRIGKIEWQDWHYDVLGVERPGGPKWYFGDGPDTVIVNEYGVSVVGPTSGYGAPSAW